MRKPATGAGSPAATHGFAAQCNECRVVSTNARLDLMPIISTQGSVFHV